MARAVVRGLLAVDDRQATELALSGRRDGWELLIQRHNHRVVLSLLGRGIPIDRAKDLAQEAWTRLIQQQQDGRLARLDLPGLAITQATFLALDAARRDERGPVDDAPAAIDAIAHRGGGVEERLLERERLERALRALALCPPSAQRVFRLFYEDPSIPHAELAAQVGLSVQRVRQILCEVRKALRGALEESP